MDLRDATIDWDDPDDIGSNTAHIAEHGLTPDEIETALFDENTTFDVSDSSGRPIAFGSTDTGRFIAVVFTVLNPGDPLIIRPITAYDVPEPTE
ncbi:MAG TPA: BrnT family toxin [Gemmataceae bacterium]|nr:BrnT family toxin [Gemmataceae bacterium]